ncbi:winged helix-turn-helix domain-containing protein [Aeromonas enteropelogenes]|uniref:winged helix-turn-helix domain-containing protein n=1 Tax=Aeromonas enteropelogenes TaxID=29489 RepID=UPI003BA18D63
MIDLVEKNTENDRAPLNKFINKCSQNGMVCIGCPFFNTIKKHFYIHLEQSSKNYKSYSERHLRCLCFMLSNLNGVLSKEELTEHIWNGYVVGPNSLPVLMHEMRYIIRGSGYEIINIRVRGYTLIRRMNK